MKYLENVNYDEFEQMLSTLIFDEPQICSTIDNAKRQKMNDEHFFQLQNSYDSIN